MKKPRVAIFASGSGSTFQATAEAIAQQVVDFEIGLVITDRENAGVLQRVKEMNKLPGFSIATAIINRKRYPGGAQKRGQSLEEAATTCRVLKDHQIDHLSLMGCMRIIGRQVIDEYGWRPEYAKKDPQHKGIYMARMTNTHPGILPATEDTYGIHTQEKVLELKLSETAHTFHVVAIEADTGPIIAEHRVRAYTTDTPEQLFARVQRVEKAYLPLDLDMFLKDQMTATLS